MPLKHSSSKKAFKSNVKAEMDSGKPQDQALGIAYSVKRKAKKKASGGMVESGSKDMNMAEGGYVNDSAKYEKRPMPSERDQDSKMVSRNSNIKASKNDSWTDNSTIEQAQRPSRVALSRPSLKGSDAFSVRYKDEIEQDNNRMSSEAPDGYGKQPKSAYNEAGAKRQGPKVSDMEAQHNNKRAPYKEEIEDQYSEDEASPEMKQAYAEGGRVEMEPSDSGIQEREREDEAHLMDRESPSEDEGSSDAHSRNEEDQIGHGAGPDMEDPHNKYQRSAYADGGLVHEMDDQPHDEAEEMHAASMAAAIMAEQRRNKQDSDSDIDHQIMMAEGGEILSDRDYDDIKSHGSMDSDDSDQADLSRNADEDANEEDQASFESLMKENYSESAGLDALDSPMDSAQHGDNREDSAENDHDEDIISSIRKNMRAKARR